MKQLMPQSTGDSGSAPHTLFEQVDLASVNHPAYNGSIIPGVNHSSWNAVTIAGGIPKDIGNAPANKDLGLMFKLRQSIFNYLRNRSI